VRMCKSGETVAEVLNQLESLGRVVARIQGSREAECFHVNVPTPELDMMERTAYRKIRNVAHRLPKDVADDCFGFEPSSF